MGGSAALRRAGVPHFCPPCPITTAPPSSAGTGKEDGDRHPKIMDHVLIGACARILGNIEVGHNAQVREGRGQRGKGRLGVAGCAMGEHTVGTSLAAQEGDVLGRGFCVCAAAPLRWGDHPTPPSGLTPTLRACWLRRWLQVPPCCAPSRRTRWWRARRRGRLAASQAGPPRTWIMCKRRQVVLRVCAASHPSLSYAGAADALPLPARLPQVPATKPAALLCVCISNGHDGSQPSAKTCFPPPPLLPQGEATSGKRAARWNWFGGVVPPEYLI